MLKNWKKKMIAILLIFTMTFSNFALVGKTYAAYMMEGIFGSKQEDAGDTGSSNVEFDAYFKANQDSKGSKSIVADIKSEDLSVGVTVKVKNSGYLKDAKILFGNGKELNFVIQNEIQVPIQTEELEKEQAEESLDVEQEEVVEEYETRNLAEENENVQSFENNELYIVQLNADAEMKIEFPISYEYKRFVEEKMISKTNAIRFEGTYMNDKAEEIFVSKTVDLKLSWEEEREIEISSEITKYIGFEQDGLKGIILQDSIVVDSETEAISLPIKDSLVEVSVPVIDGIKPDTVNVVAKALMGTEGKENDEVVFGEDNWKYDSEKNKITISVANQSELVSTQNENDILIDETAPMKEMYSSQSGIDQYLITYTYKNVAIQEREIVTEVEATLNEFGATKLTANNETTSELKDEIGNIVTYTNETTTNAVSKGYTYLNYNNEENKYEIEIDNKLIFNVSYKDIVDGLYYTDAGNEYISKSGKVYAQEDLYYKTFTMNRDSFIQMLGEEGFVNIYDKEEAIFTITSETPANEAGNIEIQFANTVKSIQIETSKPIQDGNIIFTTARAYANVNYEKDLYKDFDKLAIHTIGRAKYRYLNDLADVGKSDLEIQLEDTKTEATLEIGQSSLSTLAMNNNVELKIKLNNERIDSDVYGNSRFQIKLPEYIQELEVTDCNIVYGEGLEIDKVQTFEQDGRFYIDITVGGKQSALSSGIISNGTNIVLNANIKVDLFAPATEAVFALTYINDEVTNYDEEKDVGYTTATVYYSAPSGVVSVNSLSGYSADQNKTVTSVNQGKMQDEIAIYSDRKVVKTELTIMNNEKNDVSDIIILGRFPFEGVKDITTGDELGTTLNPRLISGIVPEEMNGTEFKYYYSENGEATNDLNNSSNGWTETTYAMGSIKSFLIVPVNADYKMEPASKLRFTYEYEIPANLEHNEEIYGTFVTYYINNTSVATVSGVSKADIVGLVTGAGPQFDFSITTNKTRINEFEELEIIASVKNTGKMPANDILVTIPIPEYTKYVSSTSENEKVSTLNNDQKAEFRLSTLDIEETVTLKLTVKVEQFYSETEEDISITVYALVTATDLDTILKSEEKIVTIEQAEMRVSIENTVLEGVMYKGNNVKLYIRVQNLTNDMIHNAVATMKIAEEFEFVEASVLGFDDQSSLIDIKQAKYDENTRTVTWEIGDIRSLDVASLKLKLEIGDIDNNVTKTSAFMSANATADGVGEYTSGNVEFKIGRPSLSITQTTSTTNTYVKEGETIHYQFNIKNEGAVTAQQVRLVDNVPTGLAVKSVSYISEGIAVSKAVSEKHQVTVGASIPAGDTLVVNINAVATSLNGLGERSVTNNATVSATNINSITSNDITHIIESSGRVISEQGEHSTGKASSTTEETISISKSYKITGTAWLDKDSDGMRSETEPLMKGIMATLVDSDNGIIKQETVTNSSGEYTFTGVRNGNYIIIFDYDTVFYTVTVYQKESVAQNVNSDVITTKIEQDGVLRNGAVTRVVTIENGSISNIDIGLIEALKFDLNLNMGISKITTNTAKGTTTKTYENSKLTKTEIAAKQVAGSSIYIEYTFTIKNEGEISGFAKKIVDYLPEGMEFNSGMNQDWFTGSDGNLYTTSLANIEIQPGETKTFKLVLSKQLTEDNIGTISNTAEIVEDYNIYGVSDLDSIPANKAQNEDDFARADSYVSVKTGEIFIYISVIITTIILIGIAVIVAILKIRSRWVAKGGVK